MQMFSPHPWGWTDAEELPEWTFGVFPTPVGMDRQYHQQGEELKRFPHTRGDGPPRISTQNLISRFSPHPWGWTAAQRFATRHAIVFPTPVGMDRSVNPKFRALIRFPHTRGDGP